MISEILTKKEKDQKPRFFLHDEVKAWLQDKMNVSTIIQGMGYKYVASVAYMDQPIYNRYQENVALSTGFKISSVCTIDGEHVGFLSDSYIDMAPYVNVIDVQSKRIQELEKDTIDLRNFIHQLETRIQKLEQDAKI